MAKPSPSALLTPEPTAPRPFKPAASAVVPPAASAAVSARPQPRTAPAAAPKVLEPLPAPPLASAAFTTSQPMYRRFVHPGARAIAGIDLARIQESPVGKLAVAQLESTGWKKKAAEAGLDFAADVERLVLSSPGEGGAQATLSEQAPFVVAMQGKFKIDKLRKSLAAKRARRFLHQGAELWSPANSDVSLAIVNSQVMLLGDRQSLRAVLDAAAGATAAEPGQQQEEENPVRRRASELAANYDIWMISEASMEGIAAGASLPAAGAEAFRGIDEFELGVSFRQGFATDMSFHGRTPEETARLATLLTNAKAMAALAAEGRRQPELTALLDKLKVGTAEDRAVISVAISRGEIETAMASGGGKRNKPVLTATASPATPAPQAAPPAAPPPATPAPPSPPPFVVRIYNAEGGTREVPLQR